MSDTESPWLQRVGNLLGRPSLAWVMLAISVLLTLGLWQSFEADYAARARDRFEYRAETQRLMLLDRMRDYERVLRGAAGLFAASEDVSRQEWRAYVQALALEQDLPGIQGIGFTLMLPAKDRAAHEAAVRAEGFPDYAIHPPGDRDPLSTIFYLEPFSGDNLRAFGYDMYSEPVRRDAMERARDSGQPALTGRVVLVQEGEGNRLPSFLIYLPVYRNHLPVDTVAARRVALHGFVYSPFRAQDLMRRTFKDTASDGEVEVFDGDPAPENLLFASEPTPRTARYSIDKQVVVAGHRWTLRVHSSRDFEDSTHRDQSMVILVGGLSLGMLVFAMLYLHARHHRRLKRKESQLIAASNYARSLIEASLDPMVTIDADGKITDVNQATERMTGMPRAELTGRDFADFFIDPDKARKGYQQVLVQGFVKDYLLTLQQATSGKLIDVLYNASLYCDETGKPQGVFAVARDITERQMIEDALRASLTQVERYHTQMVTLNHLNNLLLTCETRTEAYEVIARSTGGIFTGSSGGLAIYDDNSTDLQVVGRWGEPLLPATFPPHDCWALRRGEVHEVTDPARQMPCRHFIRPPASPYLCVPLTVRGEPLGLLHVGMPLDVPEDALQDWPALTQKVSGVIKLALSNLKLLETLQAQAIRDPLTGLFNRRYLDDMLGRELHRCQRTGEPLAVAMLDLDHFKGFNDTFGHDAGDAILRAVGDLLLRSTRASDLACRYGGEELTLILPGATLDHAWARLEYLRHAITKLRVLHRDSDLPAITVSIGVVVVQPGETDTTAVLSRADAALYQAKQQGRNRVVMAEN